ncbi:MAG: acyl--CoA ligase family protein [Myxococcota bacterium]
MTLLERTLRVFPDRAAIVHGDLRWNYARFGQEVGRLAGALRRAGIGAGDRVAVLLPNTPVHLAAHFALPLIEAPLVSINTRLGAAEIAYILEHSGARMLLVDPELAPALDGVLGGIDTLERVIEVADGSVCAREGAATYDDFLSGAEVLPIESHLEDENTLLSINYTSGTTGRPKGVMFSHRGGALNALGQIGAHELSKRTTFLWTLPMFHCNGWCMPWAVTGAAGVHVCLRAIDPPEVFRLIDEHGVTHFNGAPTVLLMLGSDPAAEGRRFDPPIRVCTGGAPPSPTLLARMEGLGFRVTHLYGLTETYGPHVVCEIQDGWEDLDLEERARLMSRQGVPFLFAIHLRVVDEAMNDVPADTRSIGEVVMRGNNVMLGYFQDPEATAEAFRGDWFHSGDLGVVHPDGYIELRDRSKDIIISGGENISTIEVENTLYQHPDVQEVAVVGIPDEKWGDVPKAFVTKKPGTFLTEALLIAFARERLSHFKCPKAVTFGELPKTATGKIQKFKLREAAWAGRERRIHG